MCQKGVQHKIVVSKEIFQRYFILVVKMWKQAVPSSINQLHVLRQDVKVHAKDLLTLPQVKYLGVFI